MVLLLALLAGVQLSPTPSTELRGYRLEKWAVHNDKKDKETLYLKDAKGRVVTVISDYGVGLLDEVNEDKPTLRAAFRLGKTPVVILEAWTGGAHGGNEYYVWALGARARCLLAYAKGNVSGVHDFEVVDLDGDGVPEIRSWYDGFAYSVSPSYWNIPIVFRYEHGKFVDRTPRFPELLKEAAHEAWNDVAGADRSLPPDSWQGSSAPAIRLLAIADMRHSRAAVWSRLRKLLSKESINWLRRREPTILSIIRGRNRRCKYPQPYLPKPIEFPAFPTLRMSEAFD
jgi:hypothetical protein